MARITVDDSLKQVPNPFSLILLASRRAHDLMISGLDPHITWDREDPLRDKLTVVALREIAANKITLDYLQQKPPEPRLNKPVYPVLDNEDFDMDEDFEFKMQPSSSANQGEMEEE